ncbi:hypothetical protein M426DRAFT_223827 [Hypoxylon sp. CI-4A]|nr:hypothetical protein M426DRAFT_223827 [Hypoxylon sp. CI-4A]
MNDDFEFLLCHCVYYRFVTRVRLILMYLIPATCSSNTCTYLHYLNMPVSLELFLQLTTICLLTYRVDMSMVYIDSFW